MKKAKNTDNSWSEDRLQQEMIMWFRNSYPARKNLLFSVPNGIPIRDQKGKRNHVLAKKFIATGMTTGVSDLILLRNGKCTLVEVKRPDGKNGQSPKQKDWQKLVESEGFDYLLINDLPDFKVFIRSRFGEPKKKLYV